MRRLAMACQDVAGSPTYALLARVKNDARNHQRNKIVKTNILRVLLMTYPDQQSAAAVVYLSHTCRQIQ